MEQTPLQILNAAQDSIEVFAIEGERPTSLTDEMIRELVKGKFEELLNIGMNIDEARMIFAKWLQESMEENPDFKPETVMLFTLALIDEYNLHGGNIG